MDLHEIRSKITAFNLQLLELSEQPYFKGKNRERRRINVKLTNLKKRESYKMKGTK
jgi:hypothetical protein